MGFFGGSNNDEKEESHWQEEERKRTNNGYNVKNVGRESAPMMEPDYDPDWDKIREDDD